MDITQKRQLLDSFGGKFFKAVWKMKSGEIREANCKRFIHAAFTEGHASLAKENPVGHKPEYFSACDMDKNEKWVNINLNTLSEVSCNGRVYKF
jgi:hypothetical protein